MNDVTSGADIGILNNSSIIASDEDVNLDLEHISADGAIKILENLNMECLKRDITHELESMNTEQKEYSSLKKLIRDKHSNKEMAYTILHHLGEFSKGVLSGIVANQIKFME